MTNILHVFGRMVRGGAEMRTLELMRNIDRKKYKFNFCCLSGLPGDLDDEIRSLGGNVFPLKINPVFPWKFKKLCNFKDIDVVHSHVHMFSGFLLFLASTEDIAVRIAHFRSMDDGRGDSFRRKVQRELMKSLIGKYATNILAVSEGAMTSTWGTEWKNDSRCQIIYNGFDVANFQIYSDCEGVRREFGLPSNSKLFVHVGRMTKAKNHERLISIFKNIADHEENSFLLLIGRRASEIESKIGEKIIQSGLSDKVKLVGERTDIPRLLKAANLMLFPSLWEGLPGAVIESCAAGTPVLSSDLPGVREIVSLLPGRNLVSTMSLDKDDNEWARMALSMCEDPERHQHEALNPFLKTPFSMNYCAEKFYKVWEKNSI